ncbi:unnamed protein product [Umbelopsis vinacea]
MEEGDQCFDECSLFCDALDNNIEDELPEDRGMVQYEELKLTVNQVDVREAVLAWKSQNSHKATSLLKQDSIFDLSPMSSTCAKTLFGDNWDLIVKEMAQTQVESIDLTEATLEWYFEKFTAKCKIYAIALRPQKRKKISASNENHFSRGRNDFTRIQTEWNYTGNFLMPFFRKLFRDENSLEFLWGEACLKSAAMQQNQKLYDDARRAGHTVYVYSLCRPYNGLYLFQVEATFEIPVVPVLFRKKLPKFMYDVAKMKSILLAHLDSIFSYVNSDETDQEISVLSHTSLDLH